MSIIFDFKITAFMLDSYICVMCFTSRTCMYISIYQMNYVCTIFIPYRMVMHNMKLFSKLVVSVNYVLALFCR